MSSKRDQMQARARARRKRRKTLERAQRARAGAHRAIEDTEPLIAYGARCSWWNDKDKAGTRPSGFAGVPGLPCCPHCGGVLYEIERSVFELAVERREVFRDLADRDDYPELVAWSRGRCFKRDEMLEAWAEWIESEDGHAWDAVIDLEEQP